MTKKDFNKGLQELVEKGLVKVTGDEIRFTQLGRKFSGSITKTTKKTEEHLEQVKEYALRGKQKTYDVDAELKGLLSSLPHSQLCPPEIALIFSLMELQDRYTERHVTADDMFKGVLITQLREALNGNKGIIITDLSIVYHIGSFTAGQPGYS